MDTDIVHIIEDAYGIEPYCISQTRESIIFSSKSNNKDRYILKSCQDAPERRIFTYAVHAHLNAHGFPYTDSIMKTDSDEIFIDISGKLYTCSRIIQGRQCVVENDRDLKDASILLAHMHNSSENFTKEIAGEIITGILPFADTDKYVKNDLGSMIRLYEHRSSELRRFQRLASRSRGRFDYEYMAIADHYCRVASDMCTALSESQYTSISEKYAETGAICHRDYTSHNIVFISDSIGGIVGFDCAAIDLPLLDITNLIKRRMRKCGWRATDADTILNNYSSVRPLSQGETDIIKIVLTFPQKLWRIVNKYYNSRRSWCEKSCLMKLAEIKKESAQINEFIKTF